MQWVGGKLCRCRKKKLFLGQVSFVTGGRKERPVGKKKGKRGKPSFKRDGPNQMSGSRGGEQAPKTGSEDGKKNQKKYRGEGGHWWKIKTTSSRLPSGGGEKKK